MDLAKHLRRALAVCLFLSAAAVRPALGQDIGACPPPAPSPLSAQQVQEGMAQARDRGFLWRLTKDDHSSYLYGTIHLAKREWAFPGPKILEALREIDTIALELDPLDPKTRQELGSGFNGTLTQLELAPTTKERIERRLASECVPPETISKLSPSSQIIALTILAGRRHGLEPAYGVDLMLAGFGRTANKRVVSLETIDAQRRAIRAATGPETALLLEKALDELESGRTLANMNRLATMWAEADVRLIQRFDDAAIESRSVTGRALSRQIVDERNRVMAAGIDALHGSGTKVFGAVGSLHMVGPLGLPMLMSEMGYTVEVVPLTK
jgi:uncharacterized protein YbaP (TraB family)